MTSNRPGYGYPGPIYPVIRKALIIAAIIVAAIAAYRSFTRPSIDLPVATQIAAG